MPSVAERPLAPQGKKRRRDDNDSSSSSSLSSIYYSQNQTSFHLNDKPSQQAPPPPPTFSVDEATAAAAAQKWHAISRKIIPLPAAKRQRMIVQQDDRKGIARTDNQQQQQQQVGGRTRLLLVTPCHICHRRPTKKSDLDSFADCEGCGHRTCFVCMRECGGWLSACPERETDMEDEEHEEEALSRSFHMDDAPPGNGGDNDDGYNRRERHERADASGREREKGWATGGHRSMVCSRCCIERGPDGEIVCLGCLSLMEGA